MPSATRPAQVLPAIAQHITLSQLQQSEPPMFNANQDFAGPITTTTLNHPVQNYPSLEFVQLRYLALLPEVCSLTARMMESNASNQLYLSSQKLRIPLFDRTVAVVLRRPVAKSVPLCPVTSTT
jgi:hypothetical protein